MLGSYLQKTQTGDVAFFSNKFGVETQPFDFLILSIKEIKVVLGFEELKIGVIGGHI